MLKYGRIPLRSVRLRNPNPHAQRQMIGGARRAQRGAGRFQIAGDKHIIDPQAGPDLVSQPGFRRIPDVAIRRSKRPQAVPVRRRVQISAKQPGTVGTVENSLGRRQVHPALDGKKPPVHRQDAQGPPGDAHIDIQHGSLLGDSKKNRKAVDSSAKNRQARQDGISELGVPPWGGVAGNPIQFELRGQIAGLISAHFIEADQIERLDDRADFAETR